MPYDPMNKDTIAAIATSFGLAGIGIIRLSGPLSREIAERLFRPKKAIKNFESHRLYLGQFIDPSSGEMVDEVLLSYMKAPHSYTREDVVEINSHSGHILLSRILRIVLNEGARPAEPGEFTFRAFSNGRIDLTQAEGIVDLVNSKSDKGLVLASGQIRGELRAEIEALGQKALEILARVEVAIDFPEEESAMIPREETADLMERALIKPVEKIISAHSRRKIWMDGIKTVIAGRVNAGKSSLLNRLLNEQRSIVTPIPGTTRDVIESTIYIEGLPFRLMDTAGIRKVRGKVEKIGVHLSEQKLKEADLSLILIDQNRPLNEDDMKILARSQIDKSIIIINKVDLPTRFDEGTLSKVADNRPVVKISALTGEGINDLFGVILDKVTEGDMDTASFSLAPNLRQKTALIEASQNFKSAVLNTREGYPMEIIAVDLNGGLEALAEITGETGDEDLYDKIFSEFCLGK
ncbi:tRNA uridine-5-carboxymethylaminomethyl(34) synthesis GTPase MnmE [Deltaproteobacteria bacterium]|nr:tRNA uridine-5-carboxymethylaminomethyl(34) synthesis GTPase MnmE [Deltaproteobacteria bacterium]